MGAGSTGCWSIGDTTGVVVAVGVGVVVDHFV